MPVAVKCKLLVNANDSDSLSNQLKRVREWLIDKLLVHLGKIKSVLFGTKKKLSRVNT